MTTFLADIHVLPKASVNDPQGQSIGAGLRQLGFTAVESVRAGKLIQVRLEASDRAAAERLLDEMCAQLLANPVIEQYRFEVVEAPVTPPAL